MGHSLNRKTLSIILAVILVASFVVQATASYGIQTQKIDTVGNAGRDCSIAIDSKGNPHVTYYDGNLAGLKYAYWNGTGWTIQKIEDGGVTGCNGMWSTLKLDKNDIPHVSYLNVDSSYHTHLRYATWNGQTWITQTIDPQGSWRTSLALDSKGAPHITYCSAANLKYASWTGSQWKIDIIEPGIVYVNDALGAYSSLKFDSNDNPHVSYSDQANGRLKYASWDGLKWNLETVDYQATIDTDNSLALDSTNTPSIIYVFDDGIRYAKRTSSGWSIQTVDRTGDSKWAMRSPTLALDSKGTPNICYIDSYRNGVSKYAFLNGSSWAIYGLTDYPSTRIWVSLAVDQNDTIHMVGDNGDRLEYMHFYPKTLGTPVPVPDPTPMPTPPPFTTPASLPGTPVVIDYYTNSGMYSATAIDKQGNRHVSYYNDAGLKYAYCNGTTWYVESVDVSGWYGLYTSIAVDSQERPHISYYDNINSSLKYAYRNGTQWIKQTVDEDGGGFTSIVLDSNDNPQISYDGAGAGALKYVKWDGSKWIIQTVDATAGAEFTSIALDSTQKPHISYYDWRTGNLKYARWTGSNWNLQTLDSEGDVGFSTSIAIDSKDNPRISYLDNTNKLLKYATFSGVSWNIQTVDYVANIRTLGQNWQNATSLALDSNGYPHIAYYDGTCGNLRYAYWNGNEWTYQIADSASNVGYHASLALDATGRAHISYFDENHRNLRFISSVNSSGFPPNVAPNIAPTPTAAPTYAPSASTSPQPTIKPTPTPTPNRPGCLDVTCKSITPNGELSIQIDGQLTINKAAIPNAEILLAYSPNGGATWNNLSPAKTNNFGYFTSQLSLPATGTYLIRATWAGNATCQSITRTINFVLASTDSQQLLSITSNSTVSAVAFNSTGQSISFKVNGTTGTSGYINFYVAKTLINDTSALQVYLDDKELPYTVVSAGDSWLISFTYNHSSHEVKIQLASNPSTSDGLSGYWIVAALIAPIVAAVAAVLLIFRTKKTHNAYFPKPP